MIFFIKKYLYTMSILNDDFMVKYDFFKKQGIAQYSKVRIVAIINTACLIEDYKTLKRAWVMKYDIYPINDNDYEWWEYSKTYDDILKEYGLKN